ncbi:MAG: UDP-N-acetylglucosamine--N-acetylmuramyl-(pentapeptide) pyrophosphoryl-undecaprenol N-acetylglucosamine transferase [Minisyncoccia bacterium]|jgi:UDP-N-acetylglucosamine--N-acetylmuramyl-(pentapeptide) pyrophosphoryl-undecaprenol N-acetylglucosamine transferase
MQERPFTIVFAGGGSGGHVYPILAVAGVLRKHFEELRVPSRMVRMGPKDGYEILFQNRDIALSPIVAGKVRRYASLKNFVDVPKFFIGFFQALVKLYFIMPDVIFSKGGTGALPVVIAGWLYRIPIAIHESDAKPGLTNLFSARFARRVFVGFEEAAHYFNPQKTEVTGTPVREELLAGRTTKELAKETLGFSASAPLTLVLGGSQGSQRINEFILKNLGAIVKETQLLHQTGIANLAEVQKLSRAALIDESFRNRYQPIGFFEKNLALALTAADLVVMRSGSMLMEIAAFGLPAILIPLSESANGHQVINAYEFAKSGAAVVIEEANLLPGIFISQLKSILGNQDLCAKMSAASSKFFIPDAAEKIADELLAL